MKKIIFLFVLLSQAVAFAQQSTSKKYTLLKSTLTTVGSSTIYNNNYSVQQSIGQSGIVGKKELKASTVQQGFLTRNIYIKINNSIKESFKETLDFVLSPNPFIDYIRIDFSKKTAHDVYIKIYDINGKIHSSQKFLPSDNIIVPMKRFSVGNYLIQIKSGNVTSTKKILKIE